MKANVVYASIVACILATAVCACPTDAVFRQSVKKGLFDYLSNPAMSTLTFNEIQDIITVYLTYPDIEAEDCATLTGSSSHLTIDAIIRKTDLISDAVIPRCSDGTQYGSCSAAQPMFCYSGMLKMMCTGPDLMPATEDDCGCPSPQLCRYDGSCYTSDIACFSTADCGVDSIGAPYCIDDSVYRDRLMFTCHYPGTPAAYCSHNVVPELVETCDLCVGGACA